MKTAKVAVMVGVDQPFEIREYPLTVPEEGMAQMKLISSGVCGTDIHIHRGKIPVDMDIRTTVERFRWRFRQPLVMSLLVKL